MQAFEPPSSSSPAEPSLDPMIWSPIPPIGLPLSPSAPSQTSSIPLATHVNYIGRLNEWCAQSPIRRRMQFGPTESRGEGHNLVHFVRLEVVGEKGKAASVEGQGSKVKDARSSAARLACIALGVGMPFHNSRRSPLLNQFSSQISMG